MDVTCSALPAFRYRPLEGPKWIRILQLHSSDSPARPLECRIIHLDRDRLNASTDHTMNHYCAVSYVWGEKSAFSQYLICDANSIIKITLNVEIMLRQLRKKTKPLNLWIDAVCLNQMDKAEIGQQVQMMGKIYHQSKKVLVWMGHEDNNIAKVFAFFRTLTVFESFYDKYGKVSNDGLELLDSLLGDPPFNNTDAHAAATNKALPKGDASAALIGSVEAFLCRPWFRRRWVLQELVLSRSAMVHCCNEKISWPWLVAGLQKLVILQRGSCNSLPLGKHAERSLEVATSLGVSSRTILQNLWKFHECDCSDPRDKLFALVGFSTDALTQKQEFVDYSLSVEAIFTRFAATSISAGRFETIYKHALSFGGLHHKNETLPSWCPDWSKTRTVRDYDLLSTSPIGWPLLPQGLQDSTQERQYPVEKDIQLQLEIAKDFAAVYLHQPATVVYKCAPTRPDVKFDTWNDVFQLLIPIMPLMPISRLHACKDLASLLCDNVSRLKRLDVEQIEAVEDGLVYLLDAFQNSTSSNVGPSPEVLRTINGEVLQAIVQLMKTSTFFVAPFQLSIDAVRDTGLARNTRSFPRTSDVSDYDDFFNCFGFGPKDISPGDIVFLDSKVSLNWSTWGVSTLTLVLKRVEAGQLFSSESGHIGHEHLTRPKMALSLEAQSRMHSAKWRLPANQQPIGRLHGMAFAKCRGVNYNSVLARDPQRKDIREIATELQTSVMII